MSEQAGGEGLAVPGGAGVVGAHHLEQVDELLAGGVVVLDPVEERVELALDLGRLGGAGGVVADPRQRGDPAGVGRLGDALEQGERLVRLAPAGQQLGQPDDGARVVGLEGERLAQ